MQSAIRLEIMYLRDYYAATIMCAFFFRYYFLLVSRMWRKPLKRWKHVVFAVLADWLGWLLL